MKGINKIFISATIELIKEILIYDKRLKIKSFIKCFIMLLVSIKLKKMDIIEII